MSISLYPSSSVSISVSPYPRSRPSRSQHGINTCAPGRRSTAIHSSSIGWVVIYWAEVFWKWRTYFSTSSIPTAFISSFRGEYIHLPATSLLGCIFAGWRATLWWKLTRVLPIQGDITHVSFIGISCFVWTFILLVYLQIFKVIIRVSIKLNSEVRVSKFPPKK